MKSLGVFLVLMGAGSFVLNQLGMEFLLLGWIDLWGAAVGIAIRIALIVLGVVLMVAGSKRQA